MNKELNSRPLKSFLASCLNGLRYDAQIYADNGLIESGSAFHGIVNQLINFGYSPRTAVSTVKRLEKMAGVERG